jgi:hypothetical protein
LDILSDQYQRRLLALRDRLGRKVKSLDITRSGVNGHGIVPELESHRPYVPGDETRYIDWNLYARHDRFFLKSMLKEQQGVFHILVDTSESMRVPFARKRELSLEVAAALAYLVLCGGGKVIQYGWGDGLLSTREHQGELGQPYELIHSLSSIGEGTTTHLEKTLHSLLRLPETPNSWLVILSDFIDTGQYARELNHLRSEGVIVKAIQILHPEEIRFRQRGNLRLIDPESDRRINRVVGYRMRREMEELINRFLQDTEGQFRSLGVPMLRAMCGSQFEEIVLNYLALDGSRV